MEVTNLIEVYCKNFIIDKVIYESPKVLKVGGYVLTKQGKQLRSVLTTFNANKFEVVKAALGCEVTFKGTFRENGYKDKNGNWAKDYLIDILGLVVTKENVIKAADDFTDVTFNDDDIPF